MNVVRRAVEEPMRCFAANAGHEASLWWTRVKEMNGDEGFNALTERYEDLVAAGVIDPAKVVRSGPAERCVGGRPAADHRGCDVAYAGDGFHNLSRKGRLHGSRWFCQPPHQRLARMSPVPPKKETVAPIASGSAVRSPRCLR
jgi:hypothetical protein